MAFRVVILLLTLAVTSHAARSTNPIRLVSDGEPSHSNPLLRPKSVSSARKLNCLSWLLAVETENIYGWKVVPETCKYFVADFMTRNEYSDACEYVADVAIEYAKSLNLAGVAKPVWIFDVDETTLSNLPYYSRDTVQFGALPYNSTAFHEWLLKEQAIAVPGVSRLFDELYSLGIKVVFLTGTRDRYRNAISSNLQKLGYIPWEKIIFKNGNDNRPTREYKVAARKQLVEEGYEIVGNIGDQWIDLEGGFNGQRTFKIPNPMYYVG